MSKQSTPQDSLRFAAAIHQDQSPAQAVKSVLEQVAKQLDGRPAHAAFLFVSTLYQVVDWRALIQKIRKELGQPVLIGCTAGGVLAQDQELESTPAVALAAAHLPRVKVHPFSVEPDQASEEQGAGFWIEQLGASPSDKPVGILLPEPFSCDCMSLVASLNQAYPGMPVIGGLASGASQAGENSLFYNDQILSEGAVGMLLTGDIQVKTIVSQGCRPVGRPYIATKVEENMILELAGTPATEALKSLYADLSDKDKELAQRALLIGVVANEYKEKFNRGDFLIRNLIGIDPSSGAIAIGDRIQAGQTVQFHVRDAETSKEDLNHLLKEAKDSVNHAAGGLLFSCLGRGKELYGKPHVDIRAIQAAIGPCPIAGFFCNGEIGPIGKTNYIHGFTSSLGLLCPRD